MSKNTIFALSSAPGKAGISIYRISGPRSLEIIKNLAGNKDYVPRKLYNATLINPETQEEIDDAMICYFKAPMSFTGEDVVEIYCHGSIAVGSILTETILKMDDVRYAIGGEFSRRAVLNGKMDLLSAEGLMDLINSETTLQKRQALKQMNGGLSEETNKWRTQIIKIMSLVEAYIDFPDEDIPSLVLEDSEAIIANLTSSLSNFLGDQKKGERLRSGISLTIYGKPNVGKSSLINYLTKREVAIVSDISGTTRDVIETHLDIGGYPIILKDTAGIREDTIDPIEIEGIKRALSAIENSDIKIFLQSADSELEVSINDHGTINVLNKIDIKNEFNGDGFLKISVTKNIGLDLLLQKIIDLAKEFAGTGEGAVITRERHRIAIQKALNSLERVNLRSDLVLAAEDLRIAARELSLLVGKVEVDDILDQVFSSFCIGK